MATVAPLLGDLLPQYHKKNQIAEAIDVNIQTQKIVNDIETQLETYYLEIGLAVCIFAGAMTEYNCYAAGLSPSWGLLWGLPMIALVWFYNKQKVE